MNQPTSMTNKHVWLAPILWDMSDVSTQTLGGNAPDIVEINFANTITCSIPGTTVNYYPTTSGGLVIGYCQ